MEITSMDKLRITIEIRNKHIGEDMAKRVTMDLDSAAQDYTTRMGAETYFMRSELHKVISLR
jgi:hypothetical protein